MTEEEIRRKLTYHLQNLKWRDFEIFCKPYLESLGYKHVRVTPGHNDGGVDIKAMGYNRTTGQFYPVQFQLKRRGPQWNVSTNDVKKYIDGKLYNDASAHCIVTTKYLSKNAQKLADENNIRIMNIDDMVDNMIKHQNGCKMDSTGNYSLDNKIWDETKDLKAKIDKKK